jgi:uncharacterized protein (TIGR03435 family)
LFTGGIAVEAALLSIDLFTLPTALPQNRNDSAQFEVASIKPADPNSRLSIFPEFRHGTFLGRNVTLRRLVATAYDLDESRVIGPDWLIKERFDILAKAPESAGKADYKSMLQALLAERFLLSAHIEKKEIAVYDLVVGKDGPRMPLYAAGKSSPDPDQRPNARGYPMVRLSGAPERLAAILSMFVERPVIDKTGLTERYEIYLSFSPPSPAGSPPVGAPPDLFTALQEQLGLKLQPRKSSMDVVVIDRIRRNPGEN